jgi:hypothetical protein
MSMLRNLLVWAGLSERRKDGRIPAHGLGVSYGTGRELKRAKVKDISATGIYLLTNDRLLPGTAVELTLQKRSLLDRESRLRVCLRARCVRWGDDGMGLTFAEAPETASEWSRSMAIAGKLPDASHPVQLFRVTKAIAFLLHICPAAEAEVPSLIRALNSERTERVIELLLHAEEMLASRGAEPNSGISSSLVLRILEYGSKVIDQQLLPSWAGLLVSSLLADAQDDAAIRFVILASKLDADHMAILAAACTRATRMGWEPGFVFSLPLQCPAEELRSITGIRNLTAVERDLNHLHQLGLMERTVRELGCAALEQVNMTPTVQGLKLYFKCCGYSDIPEAVESTPLENGESAALEMAS